MGATSRTSRRRALSVGSAALTIGVGLAACGPGSGSATNVTINPPTSTTLAAVETTAATTTTAITSPPSITEATTTTTPTTSTVAPSTTATPTPGSSTTAAPVTTAAPSTTTTPTSVVATTSTTGPPPIKLDDLKLTTDGIGPFLFGQTKAEVAYGLEPLLGYANRDQSTNYPKPGADGDFVNEAGDESFVAPVGSSVCFDNGLCVYFGGPNSEALKFVGYYQGETATANDPTLSSTSGVTVGSAWADFTGTMEVWPGGCYTVGSGLVDDVYLDLKSSGTNFGGPDPSGNWVDNVPDVDEVTVTGLHTGARPIELAADC